MKKTRIGMIGLGGIAQRFAKVLGTAEGAMLEAVAARDPIKAEAFREKYGAKRVCQTYQEMTEDPDVDAVYIALTHNFHYQVARMCLENGKHVLCEKPFFMHGDEARKLTTLARSKGLLLMEAMWTRCLPAFQKARSWVREGRIGEVRLVQAAFCFNFPFDPAHRLYDPAVAGGALLDAGVYPIEFAMGMLDERPEAVQSVCHKCDTGVDDYTALSFRFPSGALASLTCGLTGAVSMDAAVNGTEGRVIVEKFLMTEKVLLLNQKEEVVETFECPVDDGFIYQIEHFASLIQDGQVESPLIPHRDTIACADVFDTVYQQCELPF